MDLDSLEDYEFVFRAVDQDGAYCRYDALVSYTDAESGSSYLVYADEQPDAQGEVALYASLCDIDQVHAIADSWQPGSTPKKPPLLELTDPQSEEDWKVIHDLLKALEQEDEDE